MNPGTPICVAGLGRCTIGSSFTSRSVRGNLHGVCCVAADGGGRRRFVQLCLTSEHWSALPERFQELAAQPTATAPKVLAQHRACPGGQPALTELVVLQQQAWVTTASECSTTQSSGRTDQHAKRQRRWLTNW